MFVFTVNDSFPPLHLIRARKEMKKSPSCRKQKSVRKTGALKAEKWLALAGVFRRHGATRT
jgi:hypothetical protein